MVSWLTVILILYRNTAFRQAKINLCHLSIYIFNKQMWRKIRENLRTASLNQKFNSSYKKKGSTKPLFGRQVS